MLRGPEHGRLLQVTLSWGKLLWARHTGGSRMSPHQGALSTSSGTGGIMSCGPFCFQMLLSGCVSIRHSWLGPTAGRGAAPRRAVSAGGQAPRRRLNGDPGFWWWLTARYLVGSPTGLHESRSLLLDPVAKCLLPRSYVALADPRPPYPIQTKYGLFRNYSWTRCPQISCDFSFLGTLESRWGR